jgi:hypothetical protein
LSFRGVGRAVTLARRFRWQIANNLIDVFIFRS